MTCRHAPGDPNCSNTPGGYAAARIAREHQEYSDSKVRALEEQVKAAERRRVQQTPDASNYTIEKMIRCGAHIVLCVAYPNCAKCAYEGRKVMVFLNVQEIDVVRWRTIDPHFRDPSGQRTPTEAPPPAARFPASEEGWRDAVAYATAQGQPTVRKVDPGSK